VRFICTSTESFREGQEVAKAPTVMGAFVCPEPDSVARTQWNESPQAHEPVALGLSIVKPCFSMVSTKSMTAPLR
jgi:hypothetical protein